MSATKAKERAEARGCQGAEEKTTSVRQRVKQRMGIGAGSVGGRMIRWRRWERREGMASSSVNVAEKSDI